MTITDQQKEFIAQTVKKITGFMNLECHIEIKEELPNGSRIMFIALYAPENARFLIGKNGQNLQAFEHLVKAVLLKNFKEIGIISLDVNDYKKSRTSYLLDVAKHAVMKVRNTQKAEVLGPMPSHERRIVHMELASYPDIATESVGSEPQRRIIIKPYP